LGERREEWIRGIPGSPGIAIGRVFFLDRRRLTVPHYHIEPDAADAECDRLAHAMDNAEEELLAVRARLESDGTDEPLGILDAHMRMVKDPTLVERTRKRIHGELQNAEWALSSSIKEIKAILDGASDDYFRERRSDVDFVGERIMRNLQGLALDQPTQLESAAILIAFDLSPADTAMMHDQPVLGFATDVGGKTSHTAIVARALEIPAVVGLDVITERVGTGDLIVLDGYRGEVVLNPSPFTIRRYERRREVLKQRDALLLRGFDLPAITTDGARIHLSANIELREEVASALSHGAEGIGLYRTEFLYMNRADLPSEDEQYEVYREIVSLVAPRPVTLRTLDLGGDKLPTRLRGGREVGGPMGLRAIRLCLQDPELFRTQLRAMLRASMHGQIRIMFPMISGVDEARKAKAHLATAAHELTQRGVAFQPNVPVGAMIEVPSAVIVADLLAKEVDFFSIGTNDLIQYAMAADRVNETVAYLFRPLHPAVLRLLQRTVEAARQANIAVSMCGEMAGEPQYALILLGLGLHELSMNPGSLPFMKRILRRGARADGERLLEEALRLVTPDEVELLVHDRMQSLFPDIFQEEETTQA
jgi:phosphotransferase system enzyme I (PtsI)